MGGRSREQQQAYRTNTVLTRQSLATVRSISLPQLLISSGLQQDKHDRKQYLADGHRIAITGDKFFDFATGKGGVGAVDLQMHLAGQGFKEAVETLGGFELQPITTPIKTAFESKSIVPSPAATSRAVRDYLVSTRGLDAGLVDAAIASGAVYSDSQGNAIFKAGSEGAELTGIRDKRFKGSRGTIKEGFMLAADRPARVVVVESAIDAMSYRQLHGGNDTIISLAGNSNKVVMQQAINAAKSAGVPVVSAFDNDKGGDMARAFLSTFAAASGVTVVDHRPTAKDWNADLKANK